LDFIQMSPIAYAVSDPRAPDNPLIAVNAAFCMLTGYGEQEAIGRNCRFLAGEATEPWLTDRLRQAVRDRRPELVDILNYKKDGTPFRNAVLVTPLFDEGGELQLFLGSQVELSSDSGGSEFAGRRERAVLAVKKLPRRQREVLELIARGLLNKQVAWQLGISEKTVKMHRALLMERLGVPTSADLIRLAVEAGF
jgi:PAS domain S-box-containing protein